MGDKSYRILLVEDCKRGMSKIFTDFLFSKFSNLHLNLAASIADVEHRLEHNDFAAILLAPDLPNYDGISLVDYLKKIAHGIPLMVSLNSDDQQRIEDVKRIQVEKIFYDGNINLQEVLEVCEEYVSHKPAAGRRVVAPGLRVQEKRQSLAEVSVQDISGAVENNLDIQQEIQRHKDALLRAREESESNRDAVLKAQSEADKLREEAQYARQETEDIKQKIADLKRENAEQSRVIAESRQQVESITSVVDKTQENYGAELGKVTQEKEELAGLLGQAQNETQRLNVKIGQLEEEIADIRGKFEQTASANNELQRRLEDSENKRNVSLRDAQTALSSLQQIEEQKARVEERTGALEAKIAGLLSERDKALESSRLAGQYSAEVEKSRDEALRREQNTAAVNLEYAEKVKDLGGKLQQSQKLGDNLKQVVASLEIRCEELEAGQAALIEAEHVGLQREREGREQAENELHEVKAALGELERIDEERAKLEELLKEGQNREKELLQANTSELEAKIFQEKSRCEDLQEQVNALKGQLESKNQEMSTQVTANERYERELVEKTESVSILEGRVIEYKNMLNELEQQHLEDLKKLQDSIQNFESRLNVALAENEQLVTEKKEIMESYTNKAEAVQERLNTAEKMLKDCEWKLDNEISLKNTALERVVELGGYEDEVGQLKVELEARDNDIQGLNSVIAAQKEELAVAVENEAMLKERAQLEHLEKEMAVDKLQAQLSALQSDYQRLQGDAQREKETVFSNAQEVQVRLQDANERLKDAQWKAGETEKECLKFQERIAELESEVDTLGTLHEEVTTFKDTVEKSEKKIRALTAENERLLEWIETYREISSRVSELEKKAALADEVALEINRVSKALCEEQIEHRRLEVELRKAQERDTHFAEVTSRNKELGWELMKARTLIGQYMAQEEERALLGSDGSAAQIADIKAELQKKTELLEKTVREKENFTREQLNKVAELTELYEKAQTERLELLERLNRE